MCWIVLPTWDTSDRARVQLRYGDRDPKKSQLLVNLIMRIIKMSSRWLSGCWLMILIKHEMEKLSSHNKQLGSFIWWYRSDNEEDVWRKMWRIMVENQTDICVEVKMYVVVAHFIVLFSLIEFQYSCSVEGLVGLVLGRLLSKARGFVFVRVANLPIPKIPKPLYHYSTTAQSQLASEQTN